MVTEINGHCAGIDTLCGIGSCDVVKLLGFSSSSAIIAEPKAFLKEHHLPTIETMSN